MLKVAPFESATHMHHHHHHHHISAGEALGVFALLEIERQLRKKNEPPRHPTPVQLGLQFETPAQIREKIARIDARADAIRAERLAREALPMPLRQKVFLACAFTIGAIVVLIELATGIVH